LDATPRRHSTSIQTGAGKKQTILHRDGEVSEMSAVAGSETDTTQPRSRPLECLHLSAKCHKGERKEANVLEMLHLWLVQPLAIQNYPVNALSHGEVY